MFYGEQTTLRFFALAHLKKHISKQGIQSGIDSDNEGDRNLSTWGKIKGLRGVDIRIILTIEYLVTLKKKQIHFTLFYSEKWGGSDYEEFSNK